MIISSKILVIGGAGFIGSHLCEELSKSNDVVSLDNYLTGLTSNHIESVKYIEGSSMSINEKLDYFDPDYIFHLGEYSRVESSFDDYKIVINNNIAPLGEILTYSIQKKAKLIYAGSSTKFADSFGGKNESPYAWTKSTNTDHVINFSKWFDLDFAITYFYNAYGGREISNGKYATLIAIFKKLYKDGITKFPVVSPGTQVRNFTHYSDIVSGLIYVAKFGSGDGYGIGADKAYSILDLVEMFRATPDLMPSRKGNRMFGELISDQTKKLGWRPKVNLEEHIKEFIENSAK